MAVWDNGRRGWISLMLLWLAGCSAMPDSGRSIPSLPLAPLPTYSAGETLIYDNRRSEQVVSTRNGRTLWRDQRGYRLTRADNFIIPTLSRESRRGLYTRRLERGDPDALWPLGRGAEVQFQVSYLRPDLREFTQYWRCQDRGARRINQHQRHYDVYWVSCVRSYEDGSFRRRASEQVNFFYDPALQLVVRRDSIDLRNRRDPRQLRLWAYLRPEDASPATIKQIRDQLKNRP